MKWDDRVSRRVRLKDLHTLQTIAELGSMAKASTHLALSQPAISKAMADLEHTVGAPLLDRSAQGVELTECGRLLIERGRVIFDELLQGMREIEHRSDPTQGLIRIGTTEPITSVVSDIICSLVRRYPRITYHVNVSDTDALARQLRERTLDVLVTRWIPPLIDEDLAGEVLFQNALAVMADKSHPLVGRKKLRLGDLMDERWTLSPPDSFLGRIVVDVFSRRKLELPRAVVTTLSIYMRLGLLASGRFLTVLPRTMLRQRSNRAWLRALDIDLSDSAGPIALITLKRRRSASPLTLFEEAGRMVCSELANGA
jgi:DNA-binding transcriptional LysR family regulator